MAGGSLPGLDRPGHGHSVGHPSLVAPFMSALAGAVLAYNQQDMTSLIRAVRQSNETLYGVLLDDHIMSLLKRHQLKQYVRRVTRGVEETAKAVEQILKEFKGPAGLDIDGIPLFKSPEAADSHWCTASKHLSCMQVGF